MTEKPKYGTPVVMRLGEVSRGAGWCTDGTGNVTQYCATGTNAGGWGCWSGPGATGNSCNVGDAAALWCVGGSGVGGWP